MAVSNGLGGLLGGNFADHSYYDKRARMEDVLRHQNAQNAYASQYAQGNTIGQRIPAQPADDLLLLLLPQGDVP